MSFFKKYLIKHYRNKGQNLLKKGKTEKALKLFHKVLKYSNAPEDLFNMALALMDLFRYKEALQYFLKVKKQNPEFTMNNLALGEVYLILREWDDAKNIFTELSEKYPTTATFKNYLTILDDVSKREKYVIVKERMAKAVQALRKKDSITAIKHLKFAEQVAPEIPMIKNSLGEIYFFIKDYENAFNYFKEAIKMEPDNQKFQNNWKKILKYKK